MNGKLITPTHPGTILTQNYLQPLKITTNQLCEETNIPHTYLTGILSGMLSITPDIALRLSRYFGLPEKYWINLQTNYDIEVEKDRLQGRMEQEVQILINA